MKGDPVSDPQTRAIARKLTVTARQIVHRFDQNVEQLGVSRAKFSVVALVSRKPGVSQRAIAERLQVTEVTAGRLVERLCADGFLERRANPNDRRTYFVHLTAAAQPLLDDLSVIATEQEKQTFNGFSTEELDLLEQFLKRISANLADGRSSSMEEDVATASEVLIPT